MRWAVISVALLVAACGHEDPSPTPAPPAPIVEVPAPSPAPAPTPTPAPPLPASRVEARGPYQAEVGRDCDGYPALALETAEGLCVGIVLHTDVPAIAAASGRFRPRGIAQDPHDDDVMWLADHNGHRANAGRLWRLRRQGDGWQPEVILSRLDRAHGLRVGPDGWIYVGEVTRIVRVDPRAEDPASSREVVVDGMPSEGWNRPIRFHPLTAFVFAANGDLIVNVGSATDRCLESREEARCHDEADGTAALWRYRKTGPRSWSTEHEVYARGLRNSIALVAHPSGAILQGENGVDYREESSPHEELNVIEEGKHYGWPYCFDTSGVDPDWAHAGFACDPAENPAYAPPRRLLPPHGAPLGLLYYDGPLAPLRGRLLVSLHGYRGPGHRVLALPVDARGLPAANAEAETVVAGWDAGDRGPRGAPVELALARDGSVWLTEDNNGTVLRIAPDAWAGRRGEPADGPSEGPVAMEPTFEALHREVLVPRCGACHDYVQGDAAPARQAIQREGWLRAIEGHPNVAGRLDRRADRPMPPDAPLTAAQRARFDAWLAALSP